MKQVLIIGFFYPYREGSGRVIGLAKYLPEFGWQPIILTAPLYGKPDPQFRVIETAYRKVLDFWKRLFRFNPRESIRKQVKRRIGVTSKKSFVDFFLTRYGEIINYPDAHRNWKPFAIKTGGELLQNEHIDAMISIWPVTSHLVAKDLKARYKTPWIADFPDPWSQNHNYQYGRLRRLIDRRLELKTLLPADALVTVSQPWAENLRMLHKRKSVHAINHGYDPDILNTPPANLTAKFTITYTGSIYQGKQDTSKLFAALQDLISDRTMNPNEVEVRFYGPKEGWLAREIEGYGLSAIAKQYGVVSKQIALEKQRASQLLLLLNWEGEEGKGCYPLKTFDYLAAKRPIIATGGLGNDVIRELLNETRAGMYGSTVEEIKRILRKLYLEYKLKGETTYEGETAKINKYSHREMAKKFAEVFSSLI